MNNKSQTLQDVLVVAKVSQTFIREFEALGLSLGCDLESVLKDMRRDRLEL